MPSHAIKRSFQGTALRQVPGSLRTGMMAECATSQSPVFPPMGQGFSEGIQNISDEGSVGSAWLAPPEPTQHLRDLQCRPKMEARTVETYRSALGQLLLLITPLGIANESPSPVGSSLK